MNCPFLREARVRSCNAASVRKVLLQSGPAAGERCSTTAYSECPVYCGHAVKPPAEADGHCPFLRESLMQYCSAAAVARPVPWSESTMLRCGHSGHRYCDLYLAFAQHRPAPDETVEGIEAPLRLSYTSNHMWIDIGEDGAWRIGIDGLLAHALGEVDAVEFPASAECQRPVAVLSARGVEVQALFPHRVGAFSSNVYLRADPSRVSSTPYTLGWLFGGEQLPGPLSGLIPGADAREWMRAEVTRAAALAHEQVRHATSGTMADGGVPEPGYLAYLPWPARLRFVSEFFCPYVK